MEIPVAKHKKSMLEAFNSAGSLKPLKPKVTPIPSPEPAAEAPEPAPAVPAEPVVPPAAKAKAPEQPPASSVQPVATPIPAAQPSSEASSGPSSEDGVLQPAPRREDNPANPTPQQARTAAGAGGPFVEARTGVESQAAEGQALASAPAPTSSADEASQHGLKAPSSSLVWVLLALIITSFSAAAWWGKQPQDAGSGSGSGTDTQATGDGSQDSATNAGLGGFAPASGDPSGAGPASSGATGGAAFQAGLSSSDPLADLSNLYTVVVITYGKSHTDLASAHQEFLRDSGLPVNRLLRVKNNLVLSVGAAPTRAALADLEARIQRLTFNGERGVYSDAYVDAIQKYVER